MHVVMEQAPPIKTPTRGAAAVAEFLDFTLCVLMMLDCTMAAMIRMSLRHCIRH